MEVALCPPGVRRQVQGRKGWQLAHHPNGCCSCLSTRRGPPRRRPASASPLRSFDDIDIVLISTRNKKGEVVDSLGRWNRGFLTRKELLPCLDSWGESLDKGDVVGLALR